MAATAVYAIVSRVPNGGYQGDAVVFSNIAATTASFKLAGGRYAISVKASTYGTVTLQLLGADGTTWVTAATAIAADGFAIVELPEGTYRILIA